HPIAAELWRDLFSERHSLPTRPRFGLPQLRSLERLGAVEEAAFDRDPNGEQRGLPPRGKPSENLGIRGQLRGALDPQGLFGTRHDEYDRDSWIGEDVLQAEEQSVPLAIGNQEIPRIDDRHESWV